jgi:hypothetical protein
MSITSEPEFPNHKDDDQIKRVTIEWKDGTKEIFEGVAAKLCGMYGISLDCENCHRRLAEPTKTIKRNRKHTAK